MPIWKLTPLPKEPSDWDLSTYRGEVLIRATEESMAREIATCAFAIAAQVKEDRSTRSNPWTNSGLVSCDVVSGSGLATEGPSEVLSPQNLGHASR